MLRLETSDWVLSGLFRAQREIIGALKSPVSHPHILLAPHMTTLAALWKPT